VWASVIALLPIAAFGAERPRTAAPYRDRAALGRGSGAPRLGAYEPDIGGGGGGGSGLGDGAGWNEGALVADDEGAVAGREPGRAGRGDCVAGVRRDDGSAVAALGA
jgi:hypothetical protein